MNYNNDALKAKELVMQNYDEANQICSRLKPGYFSTNEYLDYISKFDIENKKVLSVCGSGDHAFMSLINGASRVDTFDSNPLQYYIMELKKAAIICLDEKDYLNFFPVRNANFCENYSIKYYSIIRNYLSEEARFFWDTIYSIDNPYIYLLEKFSYCIKFESDYTRKYNYLKSKLKDDSITFKNSDIFSLKDSFDEKYSLILLSNIYDHLRLRNEDYIPDSYFKFINDEILPMLTDDGSVVFHYQFMDHKNICTSNFPNSETIKCGGSDFVKVLRKK